jgi:hypothetical protein
LLYQGDLSIDSSGERGLNFTQKPSDCHARCSATPGGYRVLGCVDSAERSRFSPALWRNLLKRGALRMNEMFDTLTGES